LLGESLLLPLGVHLANGLQGNYGHAALASLGLTVGGIGLSAVAGEAGAIPLLLTPVAQLATAIAIERKGTRARQP
jgi:hypothetical protein